MVETPKSFKSLDYASLNACVTHVKKLSGPVKKVEVAPRGDFFVLANYFIPKNFMMSLNTVGEIPI